MKKKLAQPSIVSRKLNTVAENFLKIQQARIDADYVTTSKWTHDGALELAQLASKTFDTWCTIREEPEAQAYLVAMFGNARQ